jgi:phospholipid-binding lipoprotein MlaA
MHGTSSEGGRALRRSLLIVSLLALSGCGTMSAGSRALPADVARLFVGENETLAPVAEPAATDSSVVVSAADDMCTLAENAPPTEVASPPTADAAPIVLAQERDTSKDKGKDKAKAPEKDEYDEYDLEDYDPWEKLNEKIFAFNLKMDRYILKPVAKVYNKIVPDRIQIMISNVIDNANWVPRFANSLFQGKWDPAMRELSRFMLNSTAGFGGLFDVAKHAGIEKSREDFGQTLGFYGADPGPYIIVPFLEPLTLRDGLGRLVDMFLDPVGYFVPLFPYRAIIKVEDVVNDRALNLELFQGFEETTIDLYSAVRHAYLQRRAQLIKE